MDSGTADLAVLRRNLSPQSKRALAALRRELTLSQSDGLFLPKVSDKIQHGASIAALEEAGSKEEGEKKHLVSSLTEVRQSLTQEELKTMLKSRALHEVRAKISPVAGACAYDASLATSLR